VNSGKIDRITTSSPDLGTSAVSVAGDRVGVMTDRRRSEGRDPIGGSAGRRRTETQSIESVAEPDAVVAFLADPRHLPDWAPAFADTITEDATSGWKATKDGRDFSLRVRVNEDSHTVDYLRRTGPGREGGAFLRAVPRPGGGSVIVMTLPLLPDVEAADIAATLTNELNGLVRLLDQQRRT
jgi:Polyketide cyclase / dehydrase and lipid transport